MCDSCDKAEPGLIRAGDLEVGSYFRLRTTSYQDADVNTDFFQKVGAAVARRFNSDTRNTTLGISVDGKQYKILANHELVIEVDYEIEFSPMPAPALL